MRGFAKRIRRRVPLCMAAVLLLNINNPHWQAHAEDGIDVGELFNIPFSELLQTEVVSVSKRSQPLFDVAAATFVINQEHIRRSGANSIPELLRMVPGLNVAQLDANKWAISSRGFNRLYARYLLVMVDGRSVYSPLFSGVHWDALDLMLEDIDRIEVVRGPGGALWGANAVNGVINIITKRAGLTQGNLVAVEIGNEHNVLSARHGGKTKNGVNYRVYVKARETENGVDETGEENAADGWDAYRLGLRSDWTSGLSDVFTMEGEYYLGDLGAELNYTSLDAPPSYRTSKIEKTDAIAANLLMRWTRNFSSTSEIVWQFSYDNIVREELPFRERHDSYDVDVLHRFALSQNQMFTWGMNYRYIRQETDKSFRFSFENDQASVENAGLFLQNELLLLNRQLSITLGSKFEYYEYTGLEVQPSLKFSWMPSDSETYWASVSRSVRTPARIDEDVRINVSAFASGMCSNGNLCLVSILGNPSIESETVLAYELGFRGKSAKSFTYDLSMFYNEYSDLLATRAGARFAEGGDLPAHEVIPRLFVNDAEGHTSGIELSTTWQVLPVWRLLAGVTFLDMNVKAKDGYDVNNESPEKQFQVHSYLNVTRDVEVDVLLYYVDEIGVQYASKKIDSYLRTDVRLAWKPNEKTELVLGGRNLTDSQHAELGDIPYVVATQVERNVYLKWTHGF